MRRIGGIGRRISQGVRRVAQRPQIRQSAPAPTRARTQFVDNRTQTQAPQASTPTKRGLARDLNKAATSTAVQDKAGKPQDKAPAAKPSTGFGGLFGGLKSMTDKIGGIADSVAPKLSPEERTALEQVRSMLEPNKLGGADRTFNFGDRNAIIQSLMCDRAGLKREVSQQLRQEGKARQIPIAMRAIDGKRGILPRIARNKIQQEVPQRLRQQLGQGLRDAKIDPNTARQVDRQSRNLSFGEIRAFERNAAMLQDMQKRISERLGMDISFPNGISQEAIDFTLSGKLGIPPGAKIQPRQ